MNDTLRIVVMAEPPSGNHYKKFRVVETWTERNGRRVKVPIPQWYHTAEAKTWWELVEYSAAGRQLVSDEYEVSYIVFQGKGSRGDVDNYSKTILDSLVRSKIIRSDAAVIDLHGHKRRDPLKPRTVIMIKSAQAQLFAQVAG